MSLTSEIMETQERIDLEKVKIFAMECGLEAYNVDSMEELLDNLTEQIKELRGK